MQRTIIPISFLSSMLFWAGCQSDTVIFEVKAPDITAPTATLLPLPEEQFSLQFKLDFEAEDDDSGVAGVEILVRTSDLQWNSLGLFTESPVTFYAVESGPHAFKAVAVDSAGNQQEIPEIVQAETLVPEPIILIDQTGEAFDITNAVLRYFLTASAWEHGLGRDTIRPVVDPTWILPGEPAYPHENSTADIIALASDVEAHSYRVGDISNREVVNDFIGGAHLAVTF